MPIPNELAQPIASTDTIDMQSLSGETTSVPASHAATLAALGYQQITPEMTAAQAEQAKYGTGIVNELEAGGLGILRGSTLGLSDLALRKINPEWADSAAKIKQYNPDASTAGELGSFLIPGPSQVKALGAAGKVASQAGILQKLVGGGGEALGKIASKIVGDNIVGHAAEAGINLAAQSAVYQAANNLSEAALGDKDLTAESIMANIGHAAILGAGLGAALPIVARGTQEILNSEPVRQAASGAVKQFEKFFDPGRNYQLFSGAMKKELNPITGEKFQTAVENLANGRGANAYSSGEIVLDPATGKLVKIADGALPDQSGAAERFEKIRKQTGNAMGEITKAADEATAASGVVSQGETFSSDILGSEANGEGLLGKIAKWENNTRISPGQADSMRGDISRVESAIQAKGGNLRDLHDLRMDLDAKIGPKNWDKLGAEDIEITKDLRRVVSDSIDKQIAELSEAKLLPKDTLERWKNLNGLYGDLKTVEKPIADAIARSESNVNVFGLRFRDIGIGAVGGGVLGGPAGAALAVANKAIQTDKGLLFRAALGEKLQKLAWAEQLMNKSQSEIAKSIKGFIGGIDAEKLAVNAEKRAAGPIAYSLSEAMPAKQRTEAQQDWFGQTRKKLLTITGNPEDFMAQQGHELQQFADAAPGTADAIAQKQLQIYSYLVQQMPKNPTMPISVLNDKWQPADYQIQDFRKVVQVTRAPLSILHDMHAGVVTKSQTDAVRQLYPKIYEKILLQVQQEINEPNTNLTYNQRLKLNQLFPGADPGISSQFTAAMQPPQSKPDMPSAGRPASPNSSFGSRRASASDRLESR